MNWCAASSFLDARSRIVAERVGFEPTVGSSPTLVFKTSAIGRSAISPSISIARETQVVQGRFSAYNEFSLRGKLAASLEKRAIGKVPEWLIGTAC